MDSLYQKVVTLTNAGVENSHRFLIFPAFPPKNSSALLHPNCVPPRLSEIKSTPPPALQEQNAESKFSFPF